MCSKRLTSFAAERDVLVSLFSSSRKVELLEQRDTSNTQLFLYVERQQQETSISLCAETAATHCCLCMERQQQETAVSLCGEYVT